MKLNGNFAAPFPPAPPRSWEVEGAAAGRAGPDGFISMQGGSPLGFFVTLWTNLFPVFESKETTEDVD